MTPTEQEHVTKIMIGMSFFLFCAITLFVIAGRRTEKDRQSYNEWLAQFMVLAKARDYNIKRTSYEVLRAYYDNDYSPTETVKELEHDDLILEGDNKRN